ncbi:MAG: hypothetical protein MJE66_06520, partial [Proteobacteria bacterium]|nr:hypothetical protein [Pseudomonadota bacterium]
MTEDRLQRLSDANYLLSQCCLFGTSKTGEAVDRQHALIISCGLDAVDFNWSFPKPEARDRGRVIEEAAAHFAARSLP